MGLHFSLSRGVSLEKRAIDKMALWGKGGDIGDPVHADVLVSETNAFNLTIVYRCINLIAGSMASLPSDVVRKRGERREPVDRPATWLEQPNPESNAYEFKERIQESLLMDGNAFLLITARDALGFPAELWTLNPQQVAVVQNGPTTSFLWETTSPPTRLSRFGPTNPTGDVLHIKLNTAGGLRGMSPIGAAKQAIGLGLVTEKFGSKFFGRGQTLSGVIQMPPQTSAAVSKEYAELTREAWEAAHAGSDKAHRPGLLFGGATWQTITVPPEQAQFLETRKFQVEDIARLYGVPGFMVGMEEKNTSWGTGVSAISLSFLRFTLMPHIVRMETALSQLLPRGQFFRLNTKALLRPDPQAEADILVKMVTNGIMNHNEIRELLDREPRPKGNEFWMPTNIGQVTGTTPVQQQLPGVTDQSTSEGQ